MPLPRSLARFNRSVTNRVARPVAAVVPGFAVIHHRGRRTGTVYSTPVNAFAAGDRLVIALTYGAGADWVRNLLAAGDAEVTRRGRRLRIADPEMLPTADGMAAMPAVARPLLRGFDVDEFLTVRLAER